MAIDGSTALGLVTFSTGVFLMLKLLGLFGLRYTSRCGTPRRTSDHEVRAIREDT